MCFSENILNTAANKGLVFHVIYIIKAPVDFHQEGETTVLLIYISVSPFFHQTPIGFRGDSSAQGLRP